jgi:hypothetical protein
MLRRQVLLPLFAAAALSPAVARADESSIIRLPGDHTPYIFEAEPHILLGYAGPFDEGANPGVGFRGAVHIVDGFIPTINDSVAIGFGFDLSTHGHVLVPVVLQWNFWLSTHWSVFGEPGIAIGSGNTDTVVWPAFYAGGRYLVTKRIGITFRVGYPDVSVGCSFLL